MTPLQKLFTRHLWLKLAVHMVSNAHHFREAWLTFAPLVVDKISVSAVTLTPNKGESSSLALRCMALLVAHGVVPEEYI